MTYKPRAQRTEGVPTRRRDVHVAIAKPKRRNVADETTHSRNKLGEAVDNRGRFIGRSDVEKGAAFFWNARRKITT
jgi:hypothetical protein